MNTVGEQIANQVGTIADLDHKIKIRKEAEEVIIERARTIKNLKDADAELAGFMRQIVNLHDIQQMDESAKKGINSNIKNNVKEINQGLLDWGVEDALNEAATGFGSADS